MKIFKNTLELWLKEYVFSLSELFYSYISLRLFLNLINFWGLVQLSSVNYYRHTAHSPISSTRNLKDTKELRNKVNYICTKALQDTPIATSTSNKKCWAPIKIIDKCSFSIQQELGSSPILVLMEMGSVCWEPHLRLMTGSTQEATSSCVNVRMCQTRCQRLAAISFIRDWHLQRERGCHHDGASHGRECDICVTYRERRVITCTHSGIGTNMRTTATTTAVALEELWISQPLRRRLHSPVNFSSAPMNNRTRILPPLEDKNKNRDYQLK